MTAIALELPEELQALSRGLDAFLRTEVMERHRRHAALLDSPRRSYDERGAYVPEVLALIRAVREASARAGYYAMSAPESLGGGGLGHLAYFVAWEQVYRSCGAQYWLGHHAISHWAKGPSPVLLGLTEEFRRRHLAGLMAGTDSMCFALSEPGAGSDALAIKTRAQAEGDGWRLSGSKIWTSNSPYAQFAVVFAVTDPELAAQRKGGISAFMVPTDAPGFQLERLIHMFGHAGSDEAILHMDAVRLEPWQLVGELHKGFRISMKGVGLGRVFNTARAVGLGRWALEKAVEYTQVRSTFGRKISEYQGVTFPLADSAMGLHAAHLMGLNVCQLLDRGLPALKELSMTKAFAVEQGRHAVDRAMQAYGAMGFTNELHLSEAYVTLRRANVADGTGEILRNTVVKQLLAGDTDL